MAPLQGACICRFLHVSKPSYKPWRQLDTPALKIVCCLSIFLSASSLHYALDIDLYGQSHLRSARLTVCHPYFTIFRGPRTRRQRDRQGLCDICLQTSSFIHFERHFILPYSIRDTQPVGIPSYLIAIASGNVRYKAFKPFEGRQWKTGVWAEPEILEQSYWEFSEDTARYVITVCHKNTMT